MIQVNFTVRGESLDELQAKAEGRLALLFGDANPDLNVLLNVREMQPGDREWEAEVTAKGTVGV